MKHSNRRTGFAKMLAPVLAAWIVLGFAGALSAQEPSGSAPTDQALTEQEAARYADQSLRVSLWLDKDADQVYRRGEPIVVTFQANEDAYAVLYHVDVDGRVTILWPTTRYSDGFVFGGHQYRLPSREGNRIRVGDETGVGYVQAIASRYPFDLRDLALDFHHDNGGNVYDYHVAGDPFLAMNEVNYAVTGLEDPSAYVVTNYASYYVHEKVDHPRYLCLQCHDDTDYAPYAETCTVEIHYDYGWMNEWWGAYGFYPAYYYPAYYYVDPWTSARWVNYWYDPWYRWPVCVNYGWYGPCYDWRYSPYWRCDAWTANEQGRRRYTPLDRDTLGRDRAEAMVRTKNSLVTAERPTDDRLRRMRDRVADGDGDSVVLDPRLRDGGPAGGSARNVKPSTRSQVRYEPNQRIRTSPGLRVPGKTTASRNGGTIGRTGDRTDNGIRRTPRIGGSSVRNDRDRTPRTSTVRPHTRTGAAGDGRQTIRPVEPRGDTRRVWTNRRSSSSGDSRPQTPSTRNRPTNVRRPSNSKPSSPARSGNSGAVRRPTKRSAPKPSPPPPSRSAGGRGSKGGSRGGKSGGGSSGGRR